MLKTSIAKKLIGMSRSKVPGLILVGAGVLAVAAVISSAIDAYEQAEKKEETKPETFGQEEPDLDDLNDVHEEPEVAKLKKLDKHQFSVRTRALLAGAAVMAYAAYRAKYRGWMYTAYTLKGFNGYNADLARYYLNSLKELDTATMADRDSYLAQARASADGSTEWERFMSKYEVNKKIYDTLGVVANNSFKIKLEDYGVTDDL